MSTDETTAPAETATPIFDHHSREWRDNQDQTIEAIRARCPFGKTSAHGGYHYAMTPDVVRKIFNNPETFVSSRGTLVPPVPTPNTKIPIDLDPPDLYEWRQLLNPQFSPQLMEKERPRLRKEALALFDAAAEKGSVDMVSEVAQPLTGRATMRLIGLDPDDWHHYAIPFHNLAFGHVSMEELDKQVREMEARLERDIADRVGTPRATALIKFLSEEARFRGRPVTLEEIHNICHVLVGGGIDTTQSLVGSATVYLGEHPEKQQELLDHPERMTGAVEEFLRMWPPTQNIGRHAAKDAEVDGQEIGEGSFVLLSMVSANRDPQEFPNPYEVDFTREPNRHFSFGMGPHRCIGSHLARIEFTACIEALLKRAPGFTIRPSKENLAPSIGIFYCYEKVEVILPER